MERTLYVTDLDGTLLNNGSFVSPLSSEIISDLSHEGALITVATARTPATVVPLMEGTYTTVPYVVLTGAAIYDPATASYDHCITLTESDAGFLDSIFAREGINPFVYRFTDNGLILVYHAQQMNPKEREFYEQRKNMKLKKFTFEKTTSADGTPVLFFAIGPAEPIVRAADDIAATGRFSVSCYPDIFTDGIMLLEVFAADVNKAAAVMRLADSLGCDRVVAFGDNLNDIPMLEAATVGVAVSNGLSAVRRAADVVIGPNFDDSVARFIEADFLGDVQ